MPGLVGSAGAALLGAATALTASRTTRLITTPGLAIGYALVFTSNTSSTLLLGYLVAVSWWGVSLTAFALRLTLPILRSTLRRLADGSGV
ncbi:hypothetical protein ACVCAH_31280 [Micromonospora sp. LZ34]